MAQTRVQLKGSPKLVASLKTPDFEVDAERLYALSQFYRSDKKSDEMFATLNELTQKYPLSKWNEEGFMAAGNYYWVDLDRTQSRQLLPARCGHFPRRKKCIQRGMARGVGCVSESAARRGRQDQEFSD